MLSVGQVKWARAGAESHLSSFAPRTTSRKASETGTGGGQSHGDTTLSLFFGTTMGRLISTFIGSRSASSTATSSSPTRS